MSQKGLFESRNGGAPLANILFFLFFVSFLFQFHFRDAVKENDVQLQVPLSLSHWPIFKERHADKNTAFPRSTFRSTRFESASKSTI